MLSRTQNGLRTAKTVMKATPLNSTPPVSVILIRDDLRSESENGFFHGVLCEVSVDFLGYELFFLLEGRNPRKVGKITKFPSPVRSPESKKLQINHKIVFSE